jgi:hypothetical protein
LHSIIKRVYSYKVIITQRKTGSPADWGKARETYLGDVSMGARRHHTGSFFFSLRLPLAVKTKKPKEKKNKMARQQIIQPRPLIGFLGNLLNKNKTPKNIFYPPTGPNEHKKGE